MAPGTDVNDLLPDTALTGPNGITSVLGSLLFQFTGGPNGDVGGPQRWSRL